SRYGSVFVFSFFFSSRRRHTRFSRDWSSDVCSSDLSAPLTVIAGGVASTNLVTGNAGVPLLFLVLGVVLALFVTGYAAMSHHIKIGKRRVGKECRTRRSR